MAKEFGYNLLTFVYLPVQHRGAAKLVITKNTCKKIIKIYRKHRKYEKSDQVRAISNFLNSNTVAKISVAGEVTTIPINLTEEIAFVFIEQWNLFLKWVKTIKYGLIITATKNLNIEIDWVGNNNSFSALKAEYSINNREMGMNTIIFNNGLSYEQYGINYNDKGVSKIILTAKLWKEMSKLNNVLWISEYLRNEQVFCFLALEPNSERILYYAFDQFASLILNNKKFIDESFIKFKVGVVLEFEAAVHEQFQLLKITAMQLNNVNAYKDEV
ncbi:hypothetical protein [Spiroplasma endosymbiont of Virgichneumon dumeticola]|uniref:hypothetical protein n=1 Tax=Spiroplasma endosymbiont of Virgichneumon dumeticola TaxID=3139323 RepID=UPI0035C8CFEC